MTNGQCFFMGFVLASIIFIMTGIVLVVKPNTKISQEIVGNVQQSTNIVETLKKEHLVIRDVKSGTEAGTAEIIVEYDFLYKNSKKNNN